MAGEDRIFHIASDQTLDRVSKVLAVISLLGGVARTSAIEAALKANGVRKIESWNVSQILKRADGLAAPTELGWRLTPSGDEHLKREVPSLGSKNLSHAASSLRAHVDALPHGVLRDFVVEAVRCVEERLWRAAVVMSWIGAVRHMQDLIVARHLADFNAALQKRWTKAKSISGVEGFSAIQEADFIQVCEDIGFLDKSAKKLLLQRLDLRNAAGHPNSIQFDEEQVAAHVTFLVNNVYRRV
ncbi:MAG: hypothetical protein R3C30_06980 [Hyphomonadaceae bacterium]